MRRIKLSLGGDPPVELDLTYADAAKLILDLVRALPPETCGHILDQLLAFHRKERRR